LALNVAFTGLGEAAGALHGSANCEVDASVLDAFG
jgi:hypothetical protein